MTAEEFNIKVLPLKHKIFRFASRILGKTADSEDAVQDVLLKLWTKRDNLKEVRNIEAFAMTMTKNHCLDSIRTRKWTTDAEDRPENPGPGNDPYRKVEAGNMMEHVQEIISRLPDQQRMVIHLRDVEEKEYEEIAEAMQMEVNNVRVTLSRARKKVRDEIEKIENYEYSGN